MHLTHIFLLSHSVFVSDLFCKVFCCLIAYLCLTHSAICFVSLAICMCQHHFAHFLTVLLCVCICWPVFIHLSHSIQLLWQLPPLHLLISDSYVTISLLWHLRFFNLFLILSVKILLKKKLINNWILTTFPVNHTGSPQDKQTLS